MNLLIAVKGDFLKQAFEKPKRYRGFSYDCVSELFLSNAERRENLDVYWRKQWFAVLELFEEGTKTKLHLSLGVILSAAAGTFSVTIVR